MGNARVTLPEELHDLVRDVVADLESATGDLGLGGPPPRTRAPRRERRRSTQATILQLPEPPPAAAAPPEIAPAAAARFPAAPPPAPPKPATPAAAAPRRRAFLARVEVTSRVPHVPLPARTRRLQVACRRASPLDAARMTRMLRVAVPAVPLAPATLAGAPAWLLTLPASHPAPPLEVEAPAEPSTIALAGRAAPPETAAPAPVEAPAAVAQAVPAAAAIALPLPAVVPAAPPGELETRAPWRAILGHVTNLLIAAALALVGLLCCAVVGLVVTGHHVEEVVTGSMQPTIPIGSLVVTQQLPAGQLQAGNILVFPDPNDPKLTIVHRIIWLGHDQSGDVLVRTKGDYNALPDQWTIKKPASAQADRVIYILPGAGTVAGYLQTIGFWGLLALVIGVIGYYGVRKVREILEEDRDAVVPGSERVR